MTLSYNDRFVQTLRALLDKLDYTFCIHCLRKNSSFSVAWPDYHQVQGLIGQYFPQKKEALELLYLGIPQKRGQLEILLGPESICQLLTGGYLVEENDLLRPGWVVMLYDGLYILADISIWWPTCKNPLTDVYFGDDSLILGRHIRFDTSLSRVLDLCSGTGIQGMLAARSAQKVVSVELSEKAATVAELNSRLNGLSSKMGIRKGSLYAPVTGEAFDHIYANPPFVSTVQNTNFPICGDGGEDGLSILRQIVEGLPQHLSPQGEATIFSQCLGDDAGVFFNTELAH